MKRNGWVVVAAATAVFVLVSPAIGAGKDASGSLAWSRGGTAFTSYEFPTLAAGSRASRDFRLTNLGLPVSGKVAIRLTGSPGFLLHLNRLGGERASRPLDRPDQA